MAINYPKGVEPSKNDDRANQYSQELTRELASYTNRDVYSQRGQTLENLINEANQYYLTHDIAVVHKKPTPIKIVNVDYPARSAAKITEAYFNQPSTTDYNGVYLGKYIDFDAKETKNKTAFPLQNFHEHQIQHLQKVLNRGGIGFVIIKFVDLNETYLYPADHLIDAWQKRERDRKSIPYQTIVEMGYLINQGQLMPSLDYISALDKFLKDI